MARRFFHYFCALLLLVAQQGALVHAAWHAGGDAQARDAHAHAHAHAHERHAHDHEDESPTPADLAGLCALDTAFGQVLGGMHGSCAPPVFAEFPATIAGYTFNPRLRAEAVPALSRGPPILP